MASEVAAIGAGVPQAVGTRWFRKAGGMPPAMFGLSAKPLSGRYLSFAEREEIALLRVQGYSMTGCMSDSHWQVAEINDSDPQQNDPH